MEVYLPAQQMKKMMMSKTVTHQECYPPWLSFFLGSPIPLDTPQLTSFEQDDYQAFYQCETSAHQKGTNRFWHGTCLNIKLEPSPWLTSGTPHRG